MEYAKCKTTEMLLNNGNGQTLTFLGLLLSLRCSRGRFTLCRCGSCAFRAALIFLFWGALVVLEGLILMYQEAQDMDIQFWSGGGKKETCC